MVWVREIETMFYGFAPCSSHNSLGMGEKSILQFKPLTLQPWGSYVVTLAKSRQRWMLNIRFFCLTAEFCMNVMLCVNFTVNRFIRVFNKTRAFRHQWYFLWRAFSCYHQFHHLQYMYNRTSAHPVINLIHSDNVSLKQIRVSKAFVQIMLNPSNATMNPFTQ